MKYINITRISCVSYKYHSNMYHTNISKYNSNITWMHEAYGCHHRHIHHGTIFPNKWRISSSITWDPLTGRGLAQLHHHWFIMAEGIALPRFATFCTLCTFLMISVITQISDLKNEVMSVRLSTGTHKKPKRMSRPRGKSVVRFHKDSHDDSNPTTSYHTHVI